MALAPLSQDTIRLIKSTQVITTPSSIVKELFENSLDAKATAISVKLEKFGFHRLEVRDNGSGITADDVALIAKPHYTSKISSFSDLSSLTSYGFRGEALSSLCAVADVNVTTKRKEDPMGHSYSFNHKGDITTKVPAATPNGTTVIVKNLFKNIPVRHQYYSNTKHCKEEMKKIENLLMALAIAAPNVHITFSHDRTNIFQKNSAVDLQGVFMNIFPEITKGFALRSKKCEDTSMEIFLPQRKFCCVAEYGRSSVDRLFTLVNKRPVSHKAAEKIVKAYFSPRNDSCHGRYPVGYVSLTVPPDAMDINLEPNKNKVLLREENEILQTLKELLEDLYGPLELSEKKKGNGSSSSIAIEDITCTFAGPTQCPEKTQKSKPHRNEVSSVTHRGGDDMLVDDFMPTRPQASQVQTVGVSACTKSQGNILRKNPVSRQTSGLETDSSSETESSFSRGNLNSRDVSLAPKVVIGRDSSSLADNLEGTTDKDPGHEFNRSENSIVFGRGRLASTPTGTGRNESYPNLSLSTIHSSGESSANAPASQSLNSSKGEVMKQQVPLNSSLSNCSLRKSLSLKRVSSSQDVNSLHCENLGTKVNDNASKVMRVDSDLMHESVIGNDGIPVHKITPLSSNPSDESSSINESILRPMLSNPSDLSRSINESTVRNSVQNHESFIGSDGIPVYKIPPVQSESADVTLVTEDSHSKQKRNQDGSLQVNPLSRHEPKEKVNRDANDNQNKENDCRQVLSEQAHRRSFSPEALSNKSSNVDVSRQVLSEQGSAEKVHSDIEDCEKKGNWSRGIREDGVDIQTVKILKPQNGTLGNSKSSPKKTDGKRVLLSSSEDGATPPRKKKLNSLGPASFEYVHSKAVKKPSSPFILFSRDIRTQVLSENPGADFALIAKEMADRWKTLDEITKKHYQDMAKEDNERYQKEVRKIKESRGLNSTVEMTPPDGLGKRATLDRFVAPLTPELVKKGEKIVQRQPIVTKHPWKEHQKDVNITIDAIKEKISERLSPVSPDACNTPKLIGTLANGGGWICMKDGDVCALNSSRLQETILCHNLYQSFKIPSPSLSEPIPFNASTIEAANWALLVKFKREKLAERNVFIVTDKRIFMNGFKIALYPSSHNNNVLSHGEIIGMSNNMGFYGLSDFKEILSTLVKNPSASVSQTRPLKAQFWLKAEAVRMIRLGCKVLRAEDIQDRLQSWKQIFLSLDGTLRENWAEAKCFHDKPVFTSLYTMEDLPFSQSRTQTECF